RCPVAGPYCRSSSQIGQCSGGRGAGSYSTPQVAHNQTAVSIPPPCRDVLPARLLAPVAVRRNPCPETRRHPGRSVHRSLCRGAPPGSRNPRIPASKTTPAAMPNAAVYEPASTNQPARTGPATAPRSFAILNTATTVPLRLPATSPTSAPGALPRNAAPAPKTAIAMSASTSDPPTASSANPAAAITAPVTKAARRPAVSAHLPAGNIRAVWTTAEETNAAPTQPGATPSESTNKRGTTALRTPSTARPTAKLAISAAGYSGVGRSVRSVGSAVPSSSVSLRSVSSVSLSASP